MDGRNVSQMRSKVYSVHTWDLLLAKRFFAPNTLELDKQLNNKVDNLVVQYCPILVIKHIKFLSGHL